MTARRAQAAGAALAAAAAVGGAVAGVRARLRRRHGETVAGTEGDSAAVGAIPQLAAAASVPAPADAGEVTVGLGDVYREARRAFGLAAREPSEASLAALHERMLALWCALTFAEPFGGKETRRLARQVRQLLGLLAERQDLVAVLGAAERTGLANGDRARFGAFGEERRERLDSRIVKRGREVFAAKPGRLAARLADERLHPAE